MATDLDVVITRFETEATQAIAELKNLRAAQQDANDNFEHGATSMRKADEATKSLGDRMRAFSREQRADARVGGYFAREFFDPFLTKGSKASELVNALESVPFPASLAWSLVHLARHHVDLALEAQPPRSETLN